MNTGTDTVSQLNDLTTQVGNANTTLADLQKSLGTQKLLEWISLALAVAALIGGVFLFLRRKK